VKFIIVSKTADGGIARHTHEVSDYLNRSEDHQVRSIVPSDNDLSDGYDEDNIDTVKIPVESLHFKTKTSNPLLLIWNFIILQVFLLREVLKFRPDYIYCVDWFPCTLCAIATKIINNHSIITIIHGAEVLYLPEHSIFKKLMKPIQVWALNQCTKVYGVSHFTADKIRGLGVNDVGVCYNGIDTRRFSYNSNANIECVDDDDIVILTVSRLQRYKGHDVVIQALSALVEEFPNIHYLIAGTGKARDEIKRIAQKNGVSDHVTFLGYVSESNLEDLYSVADIFVMPTRISAKGLEGFGISYLEAYLCHTPVIGTQEGGASSVIDHGETGLLADPRDPNDVKQHLQMLLEDKSLRERLANKGNKSVYNRFTWESVVSQIISEINDDPT
jgi:phosphatidylinositol alpha-1,6-mannosyltransferase